MQPLQGKNRFLLASQPEGGAPLTLGYYMQPLWGKNPNHGYAFAGSPSFLGTRLYTVAGQDSIGPECPTTHDFRLPRTHRAIRALAPVHRSSLCPRGT
jgi:hypothetical protein